MVALGEVAVVVVEEAVVVVVADVGKSVAVVALRQVEFRLSVQLIFQRSPELF